MIEVALDLGEGGLGLEVGRELLERQIGITEQLVFRAGNLLLDEGRLGLRGHSGICRVVEVELRAEIALRKRALAIDIALLQFDALLHQIAHLAVDLEVRDQVVVGGAGLLQGRLGLRFREAERHRIDLEQHVALR